MSVWKVSLNTNQGVEIIDFVLGVVRGWGLDVAWAIEAPGPHASCIHTSWSTLARRVRVISAETLRCLEFVYPDIHYYVYFLESSSYIYRDFPRPLLVL